MGFGAIIKRAWTITWRYRALWVLGLFAGVAGSSGGGSFNSNFNSGSTNDFTDTFSSGGSAAFESAMLRFLPLIVVVVLLLVVISIVWWILSVAAKGGLVFAVNEIEEGRPALLGKAWNAGFARFWSIFGVSFLLALPALVVGLVLGLLIVLPILVPLMRGGEPGLASFLPMCGVLILAVPVIIVLSILLSLLNELSVRYVMLSGKGAVAAIGESWRAFRSRFKDTMLMWLIAWGLNIAASLVLIIPMVIFGVIFVGPAVFAAIASKWTAFAVLMAAFVFVIMLLSLAFTAIWGTFTSALWTVFFRRLTGMEALPAAAAPAPPAPEWPERTPAPAPPAAPAAEPTPAPQAPPVAGWPVPASPPPAPRDRPCHPRHRRCLRLHRRRPPRRLRRRDRLRERTARSLRDAHRQPGRRDAACPRRAARSRHHRRRGHAGDPQAPGAL